MPISKRLSRLYSLGIVRQYMGFIRDSQPNLRARILSCELGKIVWQNARRSNRRSERQNLMED
jgi:hypothetical protein